MSINTPPDHWVNPQDFIQAASAQRHNIMEAARQASHIDDVPVTQTAGYVQANNYPLPGYPLPVTSQPQGTITFTVPQPVPQSCGGTFVESGELLICSVCHKAVPVGELSDKQYNLLTVLLAAIGHFAPPAPLGYQVYSDTAHRG